MTQRTGGRRVVTNVNLSLDGHHVGPDPRDMGWVTPFHSRGAFKINPMQADR